MSVRLVRLSAPQLCMALTFAAIVGHSSVASAFATGITGYSGKTRGIMCNTCHFGGVAPAVHFEGPSEVAAGAIATFRFVIQSQGAAQTFAGFDVATSSGQLGVVAGQGEQQLGLEITHSAPKANDAGGIASFDFTWRAPAAAGTYTLFAAGNSAHVDNLQTGDLAAATTMVITVPGASSPTPTATPEPTATPTQPAAACVGDCSADGEVTVDELITGVNIALGTAAVSVCPVLDASADGEVTIDELLLAVNAALTGCP